MDNVFKGSGVALVTPFHVDGSIDFIALKKLVRYQIDNGTDFLVVQGTTGESPTLSKQEKLEVLQAVVEENAGKLKLVFGVGGNNTADVSSFLSSLPEGIDGILSVSPYYNKPTQKGIIAHYEALAKATDLPIIVYNVPGRTGSNVLPATTLKLAEISNIVAVKEASGSMTQIMEIIQNRPKGFGVLSGDDAITMPLILSGADGVISVVANAFPALFSKMVHDSMAHRVLEAQKSHYELLNVTNMFFEEGNPGGVKVALDAIGLMKPFMRLPLFPVSDELERRITIETQRILNK